MSAGKYVVINLFILDNKTISLLLQKVNYYDYRTDIVFNTVINNEHQRIR